jgi:hypothetical protein
MDVNLKEDSDSKIEIFWRLKNLTHKKYVFYLKNGNFDNYIMKTTLDKQLFPTLWKSTFWKST